MWRAMIEADILWVRVLTPKRTPHRTATYQKNHILHKNYVLQNP